MRFWFHAVWSRPSRRTVALGAEVALGFWAATSPHVCSPTCLPAASTVLLRARNATASVAGRPNGLGEGSTESVSPVPLASVSVLDGYWFAPGSGLPDLAMRFSSWRVRWPNAEPFRSARGWSAGFRKDPARAHAWLSKRWNILNL